MKIIICDDNNQELKGLKKIIQSHMESRERTALVTAYSSSRKLEFDLEDTAQADLYILDIDMPEPNGIELAEKVKNLYPHAILFFFTSHGEYATAGYRMEAKRYILKDHPKEELYEALDYAWEMWEKQKKDCIAVLSAGSAAYIPIGEIMYVYRDGRVCRIHTLNDGELEDTRNIKDLLARLDRPCFLLIDRGVFIHIDYVYRIEGNEIVMMDRRTFPISRRRVSEVKERILKHWDS